MRLACLVVLAAGAAGCAHGAAGAGAPGTAAGAGKAVKAAKGARAARAGPGAHAAASHRAPKAHPGPAVPVPAGARRVDLRPVTPKAGQGVVRFDCRPEDAEVDVDGVTYGRVSDFDTPPYLVLAPGAHRIALRHRGYDTYHTEVYLSGSVIETVSVSLARQKVASETARETKP